MKTYTYTYTVLRYVHDTTREEFLNIGLIAVFKNDTDVEVLIKLDDINENLLTSLFKNISIEAYINSLESLCKSFEILVCNVKNGNFIPKDAYDFISNQVTMDDSSLQWSPMGSGISDNNIKNTFLNVFSRMVRRN